MVTKNNKRRNTSFLSFPWSDISKEGLECHDIGGRLELIDVNWNILLRNDQLKLCLRGRVELTNDNYDLSIKHFAQFSVISFSRTLFFSNFSKNSNQELFPHRSSVEHCNFTPDFSNSPIFKLRFSFPLKVRKIGIINWDSTVHSCFENIQRKLSDLLTTW